MATKGICTNWHPTDDDPNAVCRVFDSQKIDPVASRKANETVYRDAVMVQIGPVGSQDYHSNELKTANADKYQPRISRAWREYQGELVDDGGEPITELDGIDHDQAFKLQIAGIKTIDQLANAGEDVIARLPGGAKRLQQAAIEQTRSHTAPRRKSTRRGTAASSPEGSDLGDAA